jgi:hypothetical protein
MGDWSQQWLNLRYVTGLLNRLGADAVAVHHALVKAGKPSPLSAAQAADLGGAGGVALSGAEAVKLARTTLRRYS